MQRTFVVLSLLLFTGLVHAKPPQCAIDPPATSKPMQCAVAGCACGANCDCAAGECGDPNCPSLFAKKTLNNAIDQSAREDRPLCIWVNQVCPPCEKAMSDYIHVHVKSYQGERDYLGDPCVIVGQPNGQGQVTRVGTIPGCPADIVAQVKNLLKPRYTASPFTAPRFFQSYAPPTNFAPRGRVFMGRGGSC